MIIIAIPNPNEKKAWPRALTAIFGVILEKSGLNINSNAWEVPPDAQAEYKLNTLNATNSTKNVGINIFDAISKPLLIPLATSHITSPPKIKNGKSMEFITLILVVKYLRKQHICMEKKKGSMNLINQMVR